MWFCLLKHWTSLVYLAILVWWLLCLCLCALPIRSAHFYRQFIYSKSKCETAFKWNGSHVLCKEKLIIIRDQVIYDTTRTYLLVAHADCTWCFLSSLLNTPDTVNTSEFTLWFLWTLVCKSPASVITFISGDISLSWHGKFINSVGVWSYIFFFLISLAFEGWSKMFLVLMIASVIILCISKFGI